MAIKTLTGYLKENGKFIDYIGKYKISLELDSDVIIMSIEGTKYYINIMDKYYAQETIQDILYDNYKTEIRFCEECGKPYDAGFIAGDGDWYCCDDCFEKAMNETYGEGKWRATDEEGEYGGYYESLDGDEWIDTGIFYTEWN